MRAVALLLALSVLAVALPSSSGARFTARSVNAHNTITAAGANDWLVAWSQATDPAKLTGYATQVGTTTPAATGANDALAVDLGADPADSGTIFRRVVVAAAAATAPASSTIAVTVLPDATTGAQPITNVGVTNAGDNGSLGGTTVTATPGARFQVNLRVRTSGLTSGTTSTPRLVVRMTTASYSGSFYAYMIPVKVRA